MLNNIDTPKYRRPSLVCLLILAIAALSTPSLKSQGRYGALAYEDEIRKAARRHGIDPALVLAVVQAESAGNPYAVSKKNARGLGQFMLYTARTLRPDEFLTYTDLHEVETNLDLCAQHLRELAEKVESKFESASLKKRVFLVAAAYNSGILEDSGAIPNIRETRTYVGRVWRYYKIFKFGSGH